MHIPRKTRVNSTTEAEVEALKLAHKCDACPRTFPMQRGLKIHAAGWCDGGVTQRSRRGSLADTAARLQSGVLLRLCLARRMSASVIFFPINAPGMGLFQLFDLVGYS